MNLDDIKIAIYADGADIITVTNGILAKLYLLGKDMTEYSVETVRQFVEDGKTLGFSIIN